MIDPKKIEEWKAFLVKHIGPQPFTITVADLSAFVAEREEMIALLRRMEWTSWDPMGPGHCVACGGQSGVHQKDCKLAAFLRGA